MGFGDKLRNLSQQAKETVAENRGKIQEAVDAASVAANEKTHGKYADKIMKVNQKTGGALDNFSGESGGDATEPGEATSEAPEPAASEASEAPASEASSGPKFGDEV